MDILEYTFKEVGQSRHFKVTDRVKIYHEGVWYTGTIASFQMVRWENYRAFYDFMIQEFGNIYIFVRDAGEKVVYDDPNRVRMYIKTDAPVKNSGGLFDGYGVRSDMNATNVLFEHEPEYTPAPSFRITSSDDEAFNLPF